MKTSFKNTATKNFDTFSFDLITAKELAFIKGGDAREDDAYVDPIPRPGSFMRMNSFFQERELKN